MTAESPTTIALIVDGLKTAVLVLWYIILSPFQSHSLSRKKSQSDSIVLVTGGAGGLGLKTARKFAERGCTVVLWDCRNEALLEAMTDLKESGYKVHCQTVDLTSKVSVDAAAALLKEEVGHPKVIINNAATFSGKGFLNITEEEIDRCFKVNIHSHFWVIQQFLPHMQQQNRGHIVAISSILGMQGTAMLSDYCSTKAAVITFMESLRNEMVYCGFNGIKFTTVCPGLMTTDLFKTVRYRFNIKGILYPLDPDYVAQKILESVEAGRCNLTLPYTVQIASFVLKLLPTDAADAVIKFMGMNESMRFY